MLSRVGRILFVLYSDCRDAAFRFIDLDQRLLLSDLRPEGISCHIEGDVQVIILVHSNLFNQSGQDHLFCIIVCGIKFRCPVVDQLILRGQILHAGFFRTLLILQFDETRLTCGKICFVLLKHLFQQLCIKVAFAHDGAHDLLAEPIILRVFAEMFSLPEYPELVPDPPVRYVQADSFGALTRCLAYRLSGMHLRLVGSKGCGKNTLIQTVDWLLNVPQYRMQGNAELDKLREEAYEELEAHEHEHDAELILITLGSIAGLARDVVDRYLATRHMRKISRVLAVRRMGCVMQNPVTRLGQLLFG